MTTLEASKFDPENDPDRPKVGAVVDHEGAKYEIKKVEPRTLSQVLYGPEPSPEGFNQVLVKPHESRPGVVWLCWVGRV